jgi:general secretion pathway protein G
LESARIVRAIADVRAMSDEIMAYRIDTGDVPDSLAVLGRDGHRDPWGNPYVYLKFDAGGGNDGAKGARKDKWLTPLNSFYDLYSKGPDGETQLPLTAKSSWDDIIVAGDGLFVGVAEDF